MKLYIIGNGFDVSHSIPCRYSDFYKYLKENRTNVLKTMEKFYYVDRDSDLWSDFESSLEKDINYDSLTTIIHENVPNIGSDDIWQELSTAKTYIEQECDDLLKNIRLGFQEWITSLSTLGVRKKFKLDKSAFYITFNYTDVLEKIYNISTSNILHIHKKVGEELIFGHGKKLEDFNVREALYEDDKAYLYRDEDGDIVSSEVGHERPAEEEVRTFYEKMRKPTEKVIQNNFCFFNNLSEIDEVIVLGHSYNEIDLPYFKKIAESINEKAKWILYYYSNQDKENAEEVMEGIKIAKYLQKYKKIKKYCALRTFWDSILK